MTTATLSEPDHIRRIVSQIGTWQRLTLVLVNRQGFERSSRFRPKGEIGLLLISKVLRHEKMRIDGIDQWALIPGPRFGAVMAAMVSA